MMQILQMPELKILEISGVIQTLLALASKKEATFTQIKNMTGVSNGSLYRALKELERIGFLTVEARIVNERATKIYKLTEDGKELARHLSGLLTYLNKKRASETSSRLDKFI